MAERIVPAYVGWDAFNAAERKMYQRGKTHAACVVIDEQGVAIDIGGGTSAHTRESLGARVVGDVDASVGFSAAVIGAVPLTRVDVVVPGAAQLARGHPLVTGPDRAALPFGQATPDPVGDVVPHRVVQALGFDGAAGAHPFGPVR